MRIGSYETEGELARGGMGVVYRAREVATGQAVAIKVLLASADANERQRKRFQREARALARLRHPNVVVVREAGEQGGHPYLAMDLVEGETLEDRLRRAGPLPVLEAVSVAAKVAAALEHAHAEGLLHRDVKPDNVILRATDGEPLLTDFGLARDLDPSLSATALSVSGQFMGTPGYWPPEQASGDLQRIGPSSDVYGLGATLYAALTGHPPHGQPESLAEALLAARTKPPPPSRHRPELDAALDAIVLRCLAGEPDDRFDSAAALAAALEGYVRATGSPLRTPSKTGLLIVLALAAAGLSAFASPGLRADPSPSASATSAPTPAEDTSLSDALAAQSRGTEQVQAGDLQAAVESFDRAISLRPELAESWYRRADVRYLRGDVAGAIADWGRVLELDPDHAEALHNRGNVSLERGDVAGALQDMSRLLQLQPKSARNWSNRGLAYRRGGDLEAALADMSRAIDLDPDYASGWGNRGVVRAELGDAVRAESDLTRAIELNPDDANLWDSRGQIRTRTGATQAALRDLDKAIELDGSVAAYWNDRAAARAAAGNLVGAIADHSRAIELRPNYAAAWNNRGLILAEQGDLQGAFHDIQRAAELSPNEAEFFYNRGLISAQLGNTAGAGRDWARYLELAPGDPEGPNIRAQIDRWRQER